MAKQVAIKLPTYFLAPKEMASSTPDMQVERKIRTLILRASPR